ncbi:anthranilate synthase, component I [Candidatus Electrothrix communis]|uniref:Anthranilate synthase component 1 n=1 Tax=Candidatus Electrothrix communis TaxID=1859133 RepID=A0A3S3QWE4_9BACT|nr:anthranilate synthase, component I [Candidatus Electrothrix communis]
MYSPDLESFSEMIEQAGLVPLHRTIVADLDTPLTIFAKVAEREKHAFLFESMEGGEKWGRYSFIGLDPLLSFSSIGDAVTLRRAGSQATAEDEGGEPDVKIEEIRESVNPFQELRDLLASFNASTAPGLPRFYGGAVGFLGYDMIRFIEEIPDQHAPLDFPDSSFIVPRLVLIHDSVDQTLTVVCNVVPGKGADASDTFDTTALYQDGCRRIDKIIELIRSPLPTSLAAHAAGCPPHTFTSNMDEATYAGMVEQAKEYILSGDIIQVVLSQRFHTETTMDPFLLYRSLRHINPSPYLFYLRLDDIILIGSSPEILVRLEDDEIELRPIAGTRKRGATPQEDKELEEELLADPKERAEHLMLVDLGRNDVGRVAAGGSVTTGDLLIVEQYSHVMHIVSGVHGKLAEGKDQFDVLEACFPAGTVSGASKIRAMQVIDELEPARRGPYAGAVGYFGFSGNMDFCITIRTFVMKGNDLWIQAGAGIVSDSVPEKEFEETVNKAQGLRRAVELAEQGL